MTILPQLCLWLVLPVARVVTTNCRHSERGVCMSGKDTGSGSRRKDRFYLVHGRHSGPSNTVTVASPVAPAENAAKVMAAAAASAALQMVRGATGLGIDRFSLDRSV
jgi:hypothetical protein